jgi:DNA-binding NtrC family response regulator
MSEINAAGNGSKIMLVGPDEKHILEKRLRAAGGHVLTVSDNERALDHARHEFFDVIVLISRGSLINAAETIFNLRDLNRSITIIVVVDRLGSQTNRFLRRLLEHPIEGAQILTRRQLQKRLHERGVPGRRRPLV